MLIKLFCLLSEPLLNLVHKFFMLIKFFSFDAPGVIFFDAYKVFVDASPELTRHSNFGQGLGIGVYGLGFRV